MRNLRAAIELTLAVAAAVGCVASWLASHSTVTVAPIIAGEPETTSVTYYAPLLALAVLLGTVAGVLAVVGLARLIRGPSAPAPAPKQNSASQTEQIHDPGLGLDEPAAQP